MIDTISRFSSPRSPPQSGQQGTATGTAIASDPPAASGTPRGGKVAYRFINAIFSLEVFPARCPVVEEADELGFPARHLLYGKGIGVYRHIFQIQEDDQHVRVLRVLLGFRHAITAAHVEE